MKLTSTELRAITQAYNEGYFGKYDLKVGTRWHIVVDGHQFSVEVIHKDELDITHICGNCTTQFVTLG